METANCPEILAPKVYFSFVFLIQILH